MSKLAIKTLGSLLLITFVLGCTVDSSSTDQPGVIETAVASGLETALAGNVEPTATAVPTATPTPVPATTPEPTATPTLVPTVSPEPTATPTPEPLPADTPVPTLEPTAVPTPTPAATPTPTPTPTPTTAPTLGIGSSEWWEFVAPFSEFSRKSGDPEEATDIDLKKIYAGVFVADSWAAGSTPRDQSFRQFVESTSFESLKSLAVDTNELIDEVDVFTPWAQPYLEPVSEQESTLTFYLLFGWCLGQQSELITNEWNECIDFVSGIWELGEFAELGNVSLQKIAVAPTPTPSSTPTPTPTATAATDAVEPKLTWEVKTCTTASIEERGECEPLDMIERWNQGFVILVTASEPIEVTDYYVIMNPPPDLSDLYETPESFEQRIASAVQGQDGLVQLSSTEFYEKIASFAASGIYGFTVADQDYVDGNTSVRLGYKTILVSDGDFDAEYASHECSPDRLTIIENPEQYQYTGDFEKRFSYTATILDKAYAVEETTATIDYYLATLNGDSTQPIQISARSYQHRSWNVKDQVRFFGWLNGVGEAGWSYINPTPIFWAMGSAPATTSECVAG